MDPETPTKRRCIQVHSEGKRIVHNVVRYFDMEALNGTLKFPIQQATKRACASTGFSEKFIEKIRKQGRGKANPTFESPKKGRRKIPETTALDGLDRAMIRRTVHELYVQYKKVPTIPKLLPILKETINFPWQRETLRKLLFEIGFCWKKLRSNKRLLTERSDVVFKRTKYLRDIKRFRDEKRPIIYVDEKWIDLNLTFGKCWQETPRNPQIGSELQRVVIFCAGGEMDFVPNSTSLFKTDTITGDCHGLINSFMFETWATEKLIPNLPQNAVIVMDNAPYHSVEMNKPPDSSESKQAIMDWLHKNNIPYGESLRKVELMEIVRRNLPQGKTYKFDTILAEKGFLVLRLPPHNSDINVIEYVWPNIKLYLKNLSMGGDINMTTFLNLTKDAINTISAENWEKFCSTVKILENNYWERDGIIEELSEVMTFEMNDDDEEAYTFSDSEPGSSAGNEGYDDIPEIKI